MCGGKPPRGGLWTVRGFVQTNSSIHPWMMGWHVRVRSGLMNYWYEYGCTYDHVRNTCASGHGLIHHGVVDFEGPGDILHKGLLSYTYSELVPWLPWHSWQELAVAGAFAHHQLATQ